jgi:hypothetical protein
MIRIPLLVNTSSKTRELGGPCPGRVECDAQDVDTAGFDLHHEEDVQSLEEHSLGM